MLIVLMQFGECGNIIMAIILTIIIYEFYIHEIVWVKI